MSGSRGAWWPTYVFIPCRSSSCVVLNEILSSCLYQGAATIAFAIRSGVNVVLLLARIKNFPKCVCIPCSDGCATYSNTSSSQGEAFVSYTACTLRIRFFPRGCHARYAPYFSLLYDLTISKGSFVALYRVILNALPLLFPANVPLRESLRNLFSNLFSSQDEPEDFGLDDSPTSSSSPSPKRAQSLPLHISPGERREARLSSSAQAHQSWVRKKTRQWHSVLAGAVAGAIAVSFEKRSRQNVIAQQLFVRYVSPASPVISETYLWAVGCRVHITPTRRNVVSASRMAKSWFSRLRTHTPSSFYYVLMPEKMRADYICVPFEPAHAPQVI
jgi:hypothetical protein